MSAASDNAISGSEFDWLACDGEGHVGFFSTAGGGYAPDEFLRYIDSFDAAIEAILTVAPRTRAICALQLRPELVNTWQAMAERGVFAFDSDLFGGPYKLIASPTAPIRVDELPDQAADVVRRITYPHVRFSALAEASAELLRR